MQIPSRFFKQQFLSNFYTYHWVVPAFTLAVDDLLVGQHSAECWAPVDRHLCLVGQTLLEQLQENPLRPPGAVAAGVCVCDVCVCGGGQSGAKRVLVSWRGAKRALARQAKWNCTLHHHNSQWLCWHHLGQTTSRPVPCELAYSCWIHPFWAHPCWAVGFTLVGANQTEPTPVGPTPVAPPQAHMLASRLALT